MTETPVFNHELADKILAQVLMYPETHDQCFYAGEDGCGTTHCIAGWAAHLSGYLTLAAIYREFGLKPIREDAYAYAHGSSYAAGRELLGLTDEQAENLFFKYDNDAAIQLLKDYANEARAI